MTLTLDYSQAAAHVRALTGSADTVVDVRALHDTDKGRQGINMRGSLASLWPEITAWNMQGYGIFIVVNATNGTGRTINDITSIRAHFIDLDDVNTSAQSYAQACNSYPSPTFAVYTSAGKCHLYYATGGYQYLDQQRFDVIQRKLIAQYNGDTNSRDLARVLRLAGTYHMKRPDAPSMVTCAALAGYGYSVSPEQLETALHHVQVRDGSSGGRHALGDISLAAPTIDLAVTALYDTDPNLLDRAEWVATIAAFKQAVSTLIDDATAFSIFSKWCERYVATDTHGGNDPAENTKQWNSIRETQLGYQTLRRNSGTAMLGAPVAAAYYSASVASLVVPPASPTHERPLFNTELLTPAEQAVYFSDLFYITTMNVVYDARDSTYMDSARFNVKFGGKQFIYTSDAGGNKQTDDAFKACTRGTVFKIPVLYGIRFLPNLTPGSMYIDQFGRQSINTYKPAYIHRAVGDVSPFLRYIETIIPDTNDRKIYLDFLAHNIKYPGVKIRWSPVLISVEGIGKGILSEIIKHCMGRMFVYNAVPSKMQKTNNQFNDWMRDKCFIICDEIKVDDTRDLVEILKPFITDLEHVMEGKNARQGIEDTPFNWQFHSNHLDAIPVTQNGRRYAIFYLAAQTNEDLIRLGLTEEYFKAFTDWVERGMGKEIIADYFINQYDIASGSMPGRAPLTSSMPQAIIASRSALEQLIYDHIETNQNGFRSGWISLFPVREAIRLAGLSKRINDKTITKVLTEMGYASIGRAMRVYKQEGMSMTPATLYNKNPAANVSTYGQDQGYE